MALIGIVRTNIEDDEYGRVKVVLQHKFPHPKARYKFDEKYGNGRVDDVLGTYLVPIINGVYCSKGDYVVLNDSLGCENMYIVGKVRSKAQNDRSYAHGQIKEGIIVWESDYDEGSPSDDEKGVKEGTAPFKWNMLQISKQNTYYENSDKVKIRIEGKNIIVSTEEGDVTIYVGGNESVEIKGNYTVKVGGDASIEVGGNADVKVGGNADVKVSGNISTKSDGDTLIKAQASCKVESPDVTITGGKLTVKGTVTPETKGPFNCIPTCPITGVPHEGTIVVGT